MKILAMLLAAIVYNQINTTVSLAMAPNEITNPGDTLLPAEIQELISNMIEVEGGTFTMGCSQKSNPECDVFSTPEHQVTVSGFAILKYEVTIAQFAAFIKDSKYVTEAEKRKFSEAYLRGGVLGNYKGANWKCGSFGKPRPLSDNNFPVVHVSWEDAVAFCTWLSAKTGKKYQLPTEAQWEFAARGGNLSKGYLYSGSNEFEEVAVCFRNSNRDSKAVGSMAPNELGIYDMSGNVSEWCSDLILVGRNYYKDKNAVFTDPTGHPDPASKYEMNQAKRAVRGGFFSSPESWLACFGRWQAHPKYTVNNTGFRVVRVN